MPNAFAILFIVVSVGCCLPVSSSETERMDMPTLSANFSCDNPDAYPSLFSTKEKLVCMSTEKLSKI